MVNTKLLKGGIIGGLMISVIILAYYLLALYTHDISPVFFLKDGKIIDVERTGQVGDFIGGVVGTFLTLATIFLLILTLVEQQRE